LFEALKRGYYLNVIFSDDTRKLIFKGDINKEGLAQFIKATSELGYSVRDCLNHRNLNL
jgi:hypothetical protein